MYHICAKLRLDLCFLSRCVVNSDSKVDSEDDQDDDDHDDNHNDDDDDDDSA